MKKVNVYIPHGLIIVIAISMISSSCSKKNNVKPNPVTIYTVSTLAGSGTAGSNDGTGTVASFTSPSALAVSSTGVLYVGDFGNSIVRTINLTSGSVTTVAGTGVQGLLNGPALSAEFNGTANIVFDKNGNLYVADEQNNVIRKISNTGSVTTVAGAGVSGYLDGPAVTAEFNHPEGMVVDANGDIYVVESANNDIRKITMSTGMVSTYAGTGASAFNDGPVSSAAFHSPYGITMDGAGNMYVADIVNNRIRKITISTNTVSTFAGSGSQGLTNGSAATAAFYYPAGVAFDSKGNLYVAELRNNTIRKIAADGTVSTYAGNGTQGSADGPASSASFHQPIGLTFDSNDNLYVADELNNKIRKVTATVQQ
jgi:sugar lactone lactonase YvrE